MAAHALERHIALVGFMGAGKTTRGEEVASHVGRRFVDIDREIEKGGDSIATIFERDGESAFRAAEASALGRVLATGEKLVVALGGGALETDETRALLRETAFVVWLPVDPATAWNRVSGSDRPLARNEAAFAALWERRQPLYASVADATASDAEGIALAAAGVHVERGALQQLGTLVPGDGPVELVADVHVAGIHGVAAQLALGERLVDVHEVPAGEPAKAGAVLERLWRGLRIGRDGTVVALGGGTTTDLAGLAAATYMRGVAWAPVPTTLVGQVDAAIGGKTAIDVPGGKNLVGAFHWPARVVLDPALLETLPEAERRNGLAEVVKTGLLAGEPLWELAEHEQVRRCAAFKAAVCLADPHDRGLRNQLNLGHTFAHALEAAAGYELPHGEAVALGLLAALQLSGLPDEATLVEELLAPVRPRVDRDAAWAALARDKKATGGRPRLVLLDAPGRPLTGVERPDAEVRAALDALIAG
jgi:shikimate kinase/3-dehydroquinate synthase